MKIKFFCFCLLFLSPFNLSAQKEKLEKINQFNSKGQKEGYWIEDRGYDRIETYYKNGLKTGIFKSYTKKEPSTLRYFGEYLDDKEVGTWYRFGDNGTLNIQQSEFAINTDPVILYDDHPYIYPNKCYTIIYYPNGIIKCEGILLWDEDTELDDVKEFGEWKYYDETGNLIETKFFQ